MLKQLLFFTSLLLLGACSYRNDSLEELRNEPGLAEFPDYYTLQSKGSTPDKAFLFYPGGLVSPAAYLHWMRELVYREPDLLVIVVKEPANLAVLHTKKGLRIQKKFSGIQSWIIGGHSLGGAMACNTVYAEPTAFQGLILMGAYADDKKSLQGWDGAVLSFTASEDQLAKTSDIESRAHLLPNAYNMQAASDFPMPLQKHCSYYPIKGGNHSGYGSYGYQKKDGVAYISPAAQQETMIQVIQEFKKRLYP